MRKEVGRFTLENGMLSGPHAYMNDQGNAKLDGILDGKDVVFNSVAHPDFETAILVALQNDYAGWAGMKDVELWLR